MKRIFSWTLLIVATSALAQQTPDKRPKITGIDHVDFYTTAADGNNRLYAEILGLPLADPIEPGQTQRFMVGKQWVGYSPATDPSATELMDHIVLTTDYIG